MSRAKEEFENIPILNTIHNKLPLDEFEKGDFSNASKINDVLQKTIQDLFQFFTKEKVNHDSISEYISAEKARIDIIQEDIIQKEEQIKKLEKKIKENFKEFQKQEILLTQRNWGKLFDFLKINKKGNIGKFKGELEELFANSSEQKERGELDYQKFIVCPYIVEIQRLQEQIKEITDTLKKNQKDLFYGSIEKYQKALNTGGVHEHIKEEIRKSIYKFFGGDTRYQYDQRDLKTLFMDRLNNELILSPNTDQMLKKNLIKNHENKVELFFYMFEDLFMKSNIGRTRFVYNTEANILNIQEERKGKVEELFEYIQQKYDDGVSSRIFRDKENDGLTEPINFLKDQLQKPKSFSLNGYGEETKEIRKARNKLDNILEESEIRYEYERLRNFDFLKLAERKKDLKKSLEWIFIFMNPTEKDEIMLQYKDYTIMSEFFKECKLKYPAHIQKEIGFQEEGAE